MSDQNKMTVRYKALVRTWPADEKRRMPEHHTATYQYVSRDVCCDKMERAWRGDAVAFGDELDSRTSSRAQVAIFFTEDDTCEGITSYDYAIRFCPFCAAPVELIEVERVKLVAVKEMVEKITLVEEPGT